MYDEADAFVDELREADIARMRRAIVYEADEYEDHHVREDVEASYTPEEFDEQAKQLVLKALDDEVEQPEFARFGHLDMTVRWFHDVVVLQVPLGEWGGVIVTFDRDSVVDTGAFTDIALDYIDDESSEIRDVDGADESFDDAVEDAFSGQ
ncbi:MAG: hypothetical protein ABEJ80_08720 [Halarchaeum sp.]